MTQTETRRGLNPLFLVLAVLSGLPTAFFLILFMVGDGRSVILIVTTAWCGMWTWVWWAMARRYR